MWPLRDGARRRGARAAPLSTSNLDAVRSLHGEAAGLLTRASLFDLLSPDVEWWVAGPSELPWAGTFHGPAGVQEWLGLLDAELDYERFEPLQFFADDDTVVEIVSAGGRARRTGRPFESEVVRIWTFEAGRAVRVRSYYDTAVYLAAFR